MQNLRVGVIGGGAAGIGHSVVVFEKNSSVGGVWNYNEDPTADSCTYESLRTNLPTVVMQLKGFPFPAEVPCYPSHVDVLNYLKSYAAHFHVDEVIRLNSSVTRVYKDENSAWKICVSSPDRGHYEEAVDRLVVCNGHFSKPFYSTVTGIENFRGTIEHSKTYRAPGPYVGKNVLIVGRGPSGDEISKELMENGAKSAIVSSEKYVAQTSNESPDLQPQASVDHIEADGTVVLSDGTRLAPDSVEATPQAIPLDVDDSRTMKPSIDYIDPSGKVYFIDGSYIETPDAIIFCTGYVYSFGDVLPPGLLFPEALSRRENIGLDEDLTAEVVAATTAGHVVAPTYKQVFSVEDPTLAFIGLPFDTTTFQCFELQSIWMARVFSGLVELPSQSEMISNFYEEIRQTKSPLRKNVHCLGLKHFRYFTEISELSKSPVDVVDFALFGDAAYLLVNFEDFRSATYRQDPVTRKWTRRFKPKGSLTELVKTFD
ncbi:Flavin-containing monooxygenase FMO GS-OX1 [Phytophthora boehmeriae]|uniref:Flavin-containing monooxygenase FMO GS-OX1 n=1 Tax=Phytophthora boehmeriae TaxID=109152 RepID=A0A8T1X8G5_9STRA|nr:Flavin-containing monooxygenase FMO GS-OX1 [Phytophthora boehmeriae]